MTDQEHARAIAEQARQIAYEDGGSVEAWWTENHSCGGYGCCGGGKEIDRKALADLIAAALSATADTARQAEREAILDRCAPKYDELYRTTLGLLEAANIRIQQLIAALDTARNDGWQAGYSASEQTYAGTVKKLADARAATEPQIDCPACGETVKQVASATLSLALWRHWDLVCPRRSESPE